MKNKLYYQFAGSCFLLLFMFLGYVVRFYPQWLNGFDQGLTHLIRSPYPHFNQFFIWYTKFANPLTVGVLIVTFLLLLLMGKYYAEAIWLGINTILVAGFLNPFIIKPFFMRERPTLTHLVQEHSYSFPSGHSLGSMLLYGTCIFLIPIFVKSKPFSRLLQIVLGVGIFFIGVSRIYLGVHFPSDVTGGFSLGLAWLLLSYPYYLEKRFIWRFTRKQR